MRRVNYELILFWFYSSACLEMRAAMSSAVPTSLAFSLAFLFFMVLFNFSLANRVVLTFLTSLSTFLSCTNSLPLIYRILPLFILHFWVLGCGKLKNWLVYSWGRSCWREPSIVRPLIVTAQEVRVHEWGWKSLSIFWACKFIHDCIRWMLLVYFFEDCLKIVLAFN